VSVAAFYDGFAAEYHLVYGDDWDNAVDVQGAALARLIRRARPSARDVLDCACGIGTQAIGLARRGYRVVGTDISPRSIERGRVEAVRLGANVAFDVADFRDLDPVPGDFDVVMCCDNALPHLIDDADVDRALRAMRAKLRPGGLLVVSMRDFDRALAERPSLGPPSLIAGPPRRLVVRLHDWDAPDSPLHTVNFLVLTETAAGWTLAQHSTRLRTTTRDALKAAAEAAGYDPVTWVSAEDAGFHRPVMTARAAP
jgi:glycine/sarcosine N-methyltransferase